MLWAIIGVFPYNNRNDVMLLHLLSSALWENHNAKSACNLLILLLLLFYIYIMLWRYAQKRMGVSPPKNWCGAFCTW